MSCINAAVDVPWFRSHVTEDLLPKWLAVAPTPEGLLLPHVAVHICFFSWIMKGFFDGIDPSMEYAALIDGCSRWGAFFRVAMPAARPASRRSSNTSPGRLEPSAGGGLSISGLRNFAALSNSASNASRLSASFWETRATCS